MAQDNAPHEGVILFELLTGSTPLEDDSIKGQAALTVLKFIREREPENPSRRLDNQSDKGFVILCLECGWMMSN